MFPTEEKCHYGPKHAKDCYSRPLNEDCLGSYRAFCPQHALDTACFQSVMFPGGALVTSAFYLAFLFGLIENSNVSQNTALLLLAVLYGAFTVGFFHDKVLRRRLDEYLKSERELSLESGRTLTKDSLDHFTGAFLGEF